MLPAELVSDIDKLVGKRGRSAFLAELEIGRAHV